MVWVRRRKRRPKRRGYVRPSRAKPKTGWSLRQLAALGGATVRAVRVYLQREVLPRPPFAGSATRYQRRHLLWLIAIRHLLIAERSTLDAIRTRLQSMSASELEAFALARVRPGKTAEALGLSTAPRPGDTSTPAPAPASSGTPSAWPPAAPRWMRLELALGLELHVREDASERVQDLSRRVRELCSPSDAADRGPDVGRRQDAERSRREQER